ncbi:hypothetical protein [Pseudomonas xanthosomatis]|uniref:hypothetical protein n=1 Tax=Pseudomonas xanthosomatis TaxID=2842356 RepID=UPI0035116330
MSWESISCWLDGHPGIAAWAQALGSLVALAVAIGVAWWQGRQSRILFQDQINHSAEDARLHRIASLRATVEVAEIAAERVIGTARRMSDIISEGSAGRYLDALDAAAVWLAKLPIYELPGAFVARDVQSIGMLADRMARVLERISAEGRLSEDNYKSLCGISDAAEKAAQKASSFADQYTGGTDVIRAVDL